VELEQMVQNMARITVRQPILRKAWEAGEVIFPKINGGKAKTVPKGQAIILDLVS
jgi:hypothetical protein